MKKSCSLLFSLGFCALSNSLWSNPASAQISADGTTNTTVNPDGSGNFTIEQGDRAGNNLFHSFGDFSVPTNGSAFFNNAPDISNILSRVTGGNISSIDGLIRANGSANLFLINPAGILFGNNAQLDIGGSFLGTTADSILFEDGEFSATDFDNSPLLTINAPIGLNFRDNPADIVNRAGFTDLGNGENIQEAGLEVNRGQAITLVGGDINLENGRLTAPGGRIELGGLAEEGTIKFNEDLSLNFSDELSRSNVTLTGFAEIDVTSGGGGDIAIYGQNISVLGGSDICAGIGADGACGGRNDNFGSLDAQAGDIRLDALDTITIADPVSAVNNQVNTDAFGNAGDIEIITGSLTITDGGLINTSTFGLGNGGKITINASDSVSLGNEGGNGLLSSNNGRLSSNIEPGATGNSGGIEINTGSLSVNNFSQIQSQVEGQGNSGNVDINAEGTVSFDGRDETDSIPSAIFTSIESGGEGNGGDINIQAKSLEITNRAQLLSNVEGIGDAGDINIEVTDEVRLVNSILISEISEPDENGEGGRGNGGDINITTGSLILQDGSSLLADTENQGSAGNIIIEASEQVILEGKGPGAQSGSLEDGFIIPSQISSSVDADANPDVVGDGGDIEINTNSLFISDDGFINTSSANSGNAGGIGIITDSLFISDGSISASTSGLGDAGNINILASDITVQNDGSIRNTTSAQGNGGNLVINTNKFIAKEGSQISASNLGSGAAGFVDISANEIVLDGEDVEGFNSGIFSTIELNASGTAGGIKINANNLTITNGAEIDVSTIGEGDGGNIDIEVDDTITLDGKGLIEDSNGFLSDSGIFANVETGASGNGGDINISSGNLIISNGADIDVGSKGQGDGGNLFINTDTLKLNSGSILSSTGFGEGGNIKLTVTDNITLENNSLISAQALSNADGGNLTIDTNFIIAFPNEIPGDGSDIIASAVDGNGGNINITAESLLGIEERTALPGNGTNDIDASSDFGLDGKVSIVTPDTSVIQNVTELPNNIVEPEQTVAQACANGRDTDVASNFVIKGKGGIPPQPIAPLSSEIIMINGEIVANSTESYAIPTSIGDITPARGVIKTPDGRIILTATPVSGSASRMAHGSLNCG